MGACDKIPTKSSWVVVFAVVAQLVEQALRKRQVGGSIPSNGTTVNSIKVYKDPN